MNAVSLTTIRRQAADWLVLVDDPDASAGDVAAWQAWLEENPAHRQAYEDLQQVWVRAAAVDPALAQPAFRREGVRWRWAAAIAALGIGITVTVMLWRSQGETIQTATAEQRSLKLSDGSRVEMAGESRLRIKIDARQRILRLEHGEVYFDVAQEVGRPFVVRVDGHEVRALGTAFNIEKSLDRTVVTVAQGRVQIAQAGAKTAVNLSAGEQAVLGAIAAPDAAPARVSVSAVDPHVATAWRDGRLSYLHEELRYVLADVNRYIDRKIVVDDERLARLEFTGTVFLDHLDEWLGTLQGSFPVKLVERGNERLLVADRNNLR